MRKCVWRRNSSGYCAGMVENKMELGRPSRNLGRRAELKKGCCDCNLRLVLSLRKRTAVLVGTRKYSSSKM